MVSGTYPVLICGKVGSMLPAFDRLYCMAVLNVTRDSFTSVVSLPGIVIIDCWADWCPPCRAFKPIFEKAADRNPDIAFGMVDTQKEVALAVMLGITTIPRLIIFRDGIPVFSEAGGWPAKAFDELIMEIRGLDMDEVRAQIAELGEFEDDQPENETPGDDGAHGGPDCGDDDDSAPDLDGGPDGTGDDDTTMPR